ncbi:TPA: hypothetical protein PTV97_003807 [Clostridium botulinum]|nr:hypothetical protein [Clostridium botulinum]HDK7201468.1 hypothetical protein [Clostridium botulinum]HDK7314644.1 hypothetical protein [Clostridium botulinum]
MYLAIFSNEYSIGMAVEDKPYLIKNTNSIDEANEIAKEYAKKNNIQWESIDILDLKDCDSID